MEQHQYVFGATNDMLIGEQITPCVHNNARAQGRLLTLLWLLQMALQVTVKRMIRQRVAPLFQGLAGMNVNHGGGRSNDGVRTGVQGLWLRAGGGLGVAGQPAWRAAVGV